MADMGAPAQSFQSTSNSGVNSGTPSRCTVLTPPANIASYWDGALRARLNQESLETFLRSHSQHCSDRAPNPLVERLEIACLFIIDPVLSHRVHWRALCHLAYFRTLGEAIARISRGLGDVVQEPKLWRVAALRTMGRLLTPLLGIDMAASLAAASIATFGFSRCVPSIEPTLEELTVSAVKSGRADDLLALRALVSQYLQSAAESGAANLATAPMMVTISAEPPSNH